MVVLDGEELLISTCLIHHKLVRLLGSCLLQDLVADRLVLVRRLAIPLCFLLEMFSTVRYVEGSLVTNMASLKHLGLLT